MNTIKSSKRKNNLNKNILNDDELAELNNKAQFFYIIKDIISNDIVQQMKKYRQHCDTSCFTHCLHVAYYSFIITKKLGLDYKSTARAAMIHDLFLYDWRSKHRDEEFTSMHAFAHPKIALRNAKKIFDLNKKEQDIIVKHMWPLTIVFPRYLESYIVTLMDKYSAMRETYLYTKLKIRKGKNYKHIHNFS